MLKQTLFAWWLPFCFCCCFQFCVGAVLFYILSDVFFKAPFNIVFFKTPSNHHVLKCFFVSVCIESGSSPMLKKMTFPIFFVNILNGRKYFPFLIKTYHWFFFYFSSAFSSIPFSNNILKQCADSLVKVINAIDWLTGVWIYYIKATVLNCSIYFVYFVYLSFVFYLFISIHLQWQSLATFPYFVYS